MAPNSPIELAVVLLVDRSGRLLAQLRDEHAPTSPGRWSLPGGHCEPGETALTAAERELLEETGLVADDGLRPFASQVLTEPDRHKNFFYGSTRAGSAEVVVGEGEAMVFLWPTEILDGRPLSPGVGEMVRWFTASPEYAALAGSNA